MAEARGHFEVQMTPEAGTVDGIGRFSVAKTFRGDLDGSSTGEMLAVRTGVAGSAGYVLTERVVGTIGGRSGGFVLQHHGILDRGRPSLTVTVIPDSATGDLAGLSGEMTIDAANDHAYALSYRLPDPA